MRKPVDASDVHRLQDFKHALSFTKQMLHNIEEAMNRPEPKRGFNRIDNLDAQQLADLVQEAWKLSDDIMKRWN